MTTILRKPSARLQKCVGFRAPMYRSAANVSDDWKALIYKNRFFEIVIDICLKRRIIKNESDICRKLQEHYFGVNSNNKGDRYFGKNRS